MAPATAEIVSDIPAATSVIHFPHFDVVDTDPSDHFYFTGQSSYATKSTIDVIMRERKQLEQGLPDSIFIRAYKYHISLLRAAIIGAPGTPYHNFLFFFDICLPPSYPSSPPKVHYRTFGVGRVNPVLGYDGGKPSERWKPNSSTLLQVMLFIQKLAFVEKPYYNVPFEIPFLGKNRRERWAAEYNDEVLQRCCVVTAYILKRPPRNFEALVATHFRQGGLEIVTSFVAYRERRTHTRSFMEYRITFKDYSELVSAIAKNGAPVAHFVEQVGAEKDARELAKKKKKEIIDKLSKLFKKNSMQIGSKRYVPLNNDKNDS